MNETSSYLEKVASDHDISVIWTDKLAPETPPWLFAPLPQHCHEP